MKPLNKLLASLTKKQLDKLRKNYALNDGLIQKGLNPKDLEIVVRFFNPTGIGTWYLTELSPDNIGFGICHLSEIELGYVSLEELSAFKGRFGLGIEKDRYFYPKGLTLHTFLQKLQATNN